MIYSSDSTLEDTVSLYLYQQHIHYSEMARVCHFLLDPVSTEATQLTAVTLIYIEEKNYKCSFVPD